MHHKTGTHLVKGLLRNFEQEKWIHVHKVTRYTRHKQASLCDPTPRGFCRRLQRYNSLDFEALQTLGTFGHNFRLLHIIRDPIELIRSDYLYHNRSHDTQVVRHTVPEVLQGLRRTEGLIGDTLGVVESTLPEIAGVLRCRPYVQSGSVLVVGMEDDDFNSTVRCIYRFLFGPNVKLNELIFF